MFGDVGEASRQSRQSLLADFRRVYCNCNQPKNRLVQIVVQVWTECLMFVCMYHISREMPREMFVFFCCFLVRFIIV